MTINNRIKKIIDAHFEGNKSAFASAIGVTPSVVDNIVGKRQGKPSFEVLQKISAIEEVNLIWLITGKGDIANVENSSVITGDGNKISTSNNTTNHYTTNISNDNECSEKNSGDATKISELQQEVARLKAQAAMVDNYQEMLLKQAEEIGRLRERLEQSK